MYNTLFVALLSYCLLNTLAYAGKRTYQYSDAHLHYVDFFQETEGMSTLIKHMAANNIDHVMISGMSVVKKWQQNEPERPRYYLADDARLYWYSATDVLIANAVQALTLAEQARFHPFISGFNPTDLNAVDHINRMLKWYPNFWQGIGEIFTRHDDITALTYGETSRANNASLARVYKLAAKYDLPVSLHANITSTRVKEPIFLHEVEQALKQHPNTKFIWAHGGTSEAINRRMKLEFLLPTIQKMLGKYDNLWIDLSWSILHEFILDKKGQPKDAWVLLIKQHPDRFMIGSDVIGKFKNLGKNIREFDPLLDALTKQEANKVARNNFLAILPNRYHGSSNW